MDSVRKQGPLEPRPPKSPPRPLSKATILAADDLKREKVEVPEWDGQVWIRELTAAERDAYENSQIEWAYEGGKATASPDLDNTKAKLVALTAVDETGERLFDAGDADVLGAKSAAAVERLYRVAARLSGIRGPDTEDAAGNLPSEPTSGSATG